MRRVALFKLLPLAALLLAFLPVLVVAGPTSQRAKVHPLVWETLAAEAEAEVLVVLGVQADLSGAGALHTKEAKGRYVYKILSSVAETTQQDLRALLDAQGADYQSFFIVNAIKVRVDSARVRSLAARADVDRIVPNPWVQGVPVTSPSATLRANGRGSVPPPLGSRAAPNEIEPNLVRVNADDVWALGYTGQGIVVAGQDTGYDWDHPALQNQYRGWNGTEVDHDYNWHDAIHSGGGSCGPDAVEPCDDHGHGTHTMGTAVGVEADGDGGGYQIGMAPGAEWIGCRNMDVGYGTPATYMECFEFFLAPYPVDGTPAQGVPSLAPHVVNNSWSCPPSEGCDADTLEAAVTALRQAGIVVVASAGNDGYDGCGSLDRPPALYQQSFTVGAFSDATDQIAGLSSRGPVSYAGGIYTKPDIAAPGVSVRSSVPGGGYGYSSGTSMAAPHVTGAIALLLSAAPGHSGSVGAIEQVLTSTAEPRLDGQCGDPGPPNNVWGWGILDALSAVESVTSDAPIAAFVSDSPVCLGEPLVLTNISAGASTCAWDLGDGATSTEWEPAHVYSASGQYTVTLVITNALDSDAFSDVVQVEPVPTAVFHWLADDLTVTFYNDSQDANAYLWSFGDGVTSTLPAPVHTYPMSATFPVTLTAQNGCGQHLYTESVQATIESGWLQGTVTDDKSGQPIGGAEVTAVAYTLLGIGAEVTTGSSGHYSMTLPAGTYGVTVQAAGYRSQTAMDVDVIAGQVTTQDLELVPHHVQYLPLVFRVQ